MDIYDFYLGNVDKSPYYISGVSDLLTDETATETTTEVVETNVFVKLENQMSCSEEDLFYLCVENISNIDKYKDMDGFYKMDVTFVDGEVIQFEYLSEDEMKNNYKKLLKYFKNENNGGQETDDDDSDYYDSDYYDSDF